MRQVQPSPCGSAEARSRLSSVGLLLYVTVKFAVAVTWDATRACISAAAFTALLKKADILYVVLIAAALSVVIF